MATASFRSREEAGRLLARQFDGLISELGWTKSENGLPLVLAIPKGGVPVAKPIAEALEVALDVAPGAEAETFESTEFSGVTADNSSSQSNKFTERDCIVVDDVIANGAGALSAIRVLRKRGAAKIFVACAIVTTEALKKLRDLDDVEVISVHVMKELGMSISDFFDDDQVISDDEIRSMQSAAQKSQTEASGESETSWIDIHLPEITQPAQWLAADKISGVAIVFNTDGDATESHNVVESSELAFADAGLGVLSITMYHDEDIATLNHRMRQVTSWLESFAPAKNLPLGFFAVGLGGVAALSAAASLPERVKAVVCYESPLNFVEDHLPRVHAPTLLIVRDEASENLATGRAGLSSMHVETSLSLLSDSPEKLCTIAANWMNRFLLNVLNGSALKATALKKSTPSELASPDISARGGNAAVGEMNTDLAIL